MKAIWFGAGAVATLIVLGYVQLWRVAALVASGFAVYFVVETVTKARDRRDQVRQEKSDREVQWMADRQRERYESDFLPHTVRDDDDR